MSEARIQVLARGERVPRPLLTALYGIGAPEQDAVLRSLSLWAQRLFPAMPSPIGPGDAVSRWALESFYQFHRLLTPRSAAGRLGMSLESFLLIQEQLFALGHEIPDLVALPRVAYTESGMSRFHTIFPTLSQTVFGSHTDYCEDLHYALRALGLTVDPVHDPTSVLLGDTTPDFGHDWDVVTDGPVGLRYQIWLDFGRKPLQLSPDLCSYVTFARFEAHLRPHVHRYREVDGDLLREVRRRGGIA